jgi:methylisocitrate lyase
VAHEEESGAIFAAHLADQGQSLGGVLAIQIAGGLIGEDQLGAVGERPGHGDALLLAGGELARIVVETVAEPDAGQHLSGMSAVGATRAEAHAEDDIFQDGEPLEEIEGLKDIADFFGPEAVTAGLAQRGHLGGIESDATGIGAEDAGDQMQEGSLARTALAAESELFARREGETGHADYLHARALGRHKGLFQVGDGEHDVSESGETDEIANRFVQKAHQSRKFGSSTIDFPRMRRTVSPTTSAGARYESRPRRNRPDRRRPALLGDRLWPCSGFMSTPAETFRAALAAETPLQIAGAINAYAALLAQRAGFRALYLSGAGVANHSYGIPDTGETTLEDVLIDVRRIARRVPLPLLVDIDTGWDDPTATVRAMAKAGAAAVHIEDQVPAKLCGHLPGKQLVAKEEMVQRVQAAVAGRSQNDLVVMARTDAAGVEGLAAAIARAQAYIAAGADMIFAEALRTLEEYRTFTAAVKAPVLANLTEFGQTPTFSLEELRDAGVALVLYPLSASRAAAASSRDVYAAIRRDGNQRAVVDQMQTRAELYEVLGYRSPQ